MAAESEDIFLTNEEGSPNWSMNESLGNPFDIEDGCNSSPVAEEEFCSAEAAEKILAEDDKFHKIDFDEEQSVRWGNETFMNMTIGAYMAAGSDDVDKLAVNKSSTVKILSPPLRKFQESSSWLHISAEESLPHSLPQPLENTVVNASSSLEETLPNSPPVSLVSMNDPQLSCSVPVVLPDLEESSTSYDFTLSEMHRVIGSGEMTCSNVTMLLGHVQKQNEAKRAALDKHSTETPDDKAFNSKDNTQDRCPLTEPVGAVNLLPELSPPQPPEHVFKKPEVPIKKPTDNQNMPPVSQTNENFTSDVHSEPVKETRSSFAAVPPGFMNSVEEMFPHHLLSDTQSMEMSSRDESKLVSLLPETTAMSFLQDSIQTRDFVASTPLVGQKKGPTWFSGATPLDQHSIHYLLTPYKQAQVISVPERVDIPDVCCVMLGQQTQFPVVNRIKRGVKCTFTVRKASLDGKSIDFDRCPFEIKPQITLQPESEEQVKVLFTPRDQGQFWASLEVFAQNLTNPSECRTYTMVLHGKAEFPLLQVSPKNELLDFGNVIWGKYEYRSFKIQNVGKATVPIRFSIFRTESSLCNFSFCTEQSCDLSSISFTPKPEGACSVLSMSLPGLKDGEKVQTHTVKVCCHVKDVQNADKKYGEKSEKFQAVLHIDLDVPMSSHSHLSQMRIVVTAGMVKLHTDKDRMDLCTLPGDMKKGHVKVINSGNIPMNLSLHLEPQLQCFSLEMTQMILGPQVDRMVEIEYKPQYSSGGANDEADLILFDQLNEYRIPIVGQAKTVKSKISASATCISFGAVDVGKRKTQKFTIVPDSDCKLKIGIKDGNGTFQLFNGDHCIEEMTVLSVHRKVKYTVMISFQPMEVQFYSQLLTVQVFNADRFTIPIFGYGGQSHIEVTGVSQTESGEQFIDLGQIAQGSSEVRRLLVTNHGVRNAYLKATAYDVSRRELAPHRATIMPSRLLLEPNESKELILMLNPSEAETKLCISGRALVALVKLLHGDEITRQILLRSDTAQAKTYALDFDIALTARDRESADSEAISSVPPGQEVSLFKKSMGSIKLGLLAQTLTPEKLPQSLPSPVITSSSAGRRKNFSPSTRSALQPVNQNVHVSDVDKSSWSVNPADIQMTVFDARSKEFAQIINFSNKELRFTIECDDILKVVPSEGVVKSKNLIQFGIHPSDNYWNKGENPSCGLIKIACAQQTQYIRVLVIPVPERLASPVAFSHKPVEGVHCDNTVSQNSGAASSQEEYFPSTKLASSTSSLPSKLPSTHVLKPTRSQSLASAEITASATACIQASSEVIVPPVSPGNVREMKYVFTNSSCKVLSWAVRSCDLPSVKISGDSDTQRVHQSVFSLSPTSGSLKPDEVQSLKLEFIPRSFGFYSQEWMISFSPSERVHYFTIYGKGCEVTQQVNDAKQPSPSRCLNHEKPYKETKQLPEWVPVPPNADERRHEKSLEASHKRAAPPRTSLKGGTEGVKEVSLDKTHLHFGKVRRGDKQTKELHVSNPMNRDAEIIVEQDPGPPYTTRRSHFKIGKSRMIIYPITFKPVKLGKSVARISMREKHCGTALTATLEGECIQ